MKEYKEHTIQKQRISFLNILVTLFVALIIYKLFYYQVILHKQYLVLAKKQHWASKEILPKRGEIYLNDSYTKSGEYAIALNETLGMVYAIPPQIEDKNEAAKQLAPILEISKEEIAGKIKNDKDLYVPLKRKLTREQTKKIEELELSGIVLEKERWRIYPEGSLASQVLGYVDAEGNGRYGVEEYYNQELKGKPGYLLSEKDIAGITLSIGESSLTPSEDGADIVLTLDRIIQYKVEKILKKQVEDFHARGGSAIVIDPKTGKILAMANYPTFDPNQYNKIPKENYKVFKNAAVTDVWEPGSIFKPITMAAAINEDKVTPDTTFKDIGKVVIGGYPIRNSDRRAHGIQTMIQVLEKSLNLGAVFVQQKLGGKLFYDYLVKFGFGTKIEVECIGESAGVLPSYNELREGDFARMSFGQAIAVTPLQMINSISAIANKGQLMKPYLVEKIKYPDGKVKTFEPEPVSQIISEKSARTVASMMVSVIERGYGKKAKVEGYRIAGKTGTAQLPMPGSKGYYTDKTIGSFVAFGPVEDPRFVILVKIDVPLGVQWAESTAAPAAGKIAQEIINYYKIPPGG